jgi:hypothetical protein
VEAGVEKEVDIEVIEAIEEIEETEVTEVIVGVEVIIMELTEEIEVEIVGKIMILAHKFN